MKTVLVTGGVGFIGSHVCEKLLKRGDRVVCVDELNAYYDRKLKERNLSALRKHEQFSFQKADILDEKALGAVFSADRIDAIIHLAARAGVRPSLADPILYAKVNILGTVNILEGAHKHGIRKVVAASSSSVYGTNTKVPFSEEDRVDLQVSPYASSKRAMEIYCRMYHALYGIPTVCLRFFTVYGPRGRPDMAPYLFIEAVEREESIDRYGDGSTKRDYTYVDDIADGVIAALDLEDIGFEIINLGNSSPISLSEFISVVEKVTGKKAKIAQRPPQTGDVPITFADIGKAQRLLGYSPRIAIEEGMRRTAGWYRTEMMSS